MCATNYLWSTKIQGFFLSDTIIEEAWSPPLSDAGGAEARRRRDFFRRFCCFSARYYMLYFVIVFSSLSPSLGDKLLYLSLPGTGRSPNLLSSSMHDLRRALPGSDLFSGRTRKPAIKIFASSCGPAEATELGSVACPFDGRTAPLYQSLEAGDSATLVVHRPHRSPTVLDQSMKTAVDGLTHFHINFTVIVSSTPLSSLQSPSMAVPSRALHRPPCSCNSQGSFAVGQRNLGFPLLGLFHLGPFGLSPWTNTESGGLFSTLRPKSDLHRSWNIAWCFLSHLKFPKHRGHALTVAVILIQALAGFYLCSRPRSVLNFLLFNPSLVSRRQILTIGRGLLLSCLLFSVQDRVNQQSTAFKQFQLSFDTILVSSVESNSLLERGKYLWGPIPMKSPTFLTDSLSSFMVHTRPEDVTVLMLMRSEVLKFSKSPYAVQAVTTPKLAADLVVRFNLEWILKPSNSLVDTLPNSYQFVFLSSLVQLVSLSLLYVCSYALALYGLLSGLSDGAVLLCNNLLA